jgi:hypothetical protein
MSVVRAKVQGPKIEVLEQREYVVLYRERFHEGVGLVYTHYLSSCDHFSDIIYIGDDGYLWVFHTSSLARVREDYLSLFLDDETTEQIRNEVWSVKTFDDFFKLMDKLLKTPFCESGKMPKPWLYRICS